MIVILLVFSIAPPPLRSLLECKGEGKAKMLGTNNQIDTPIKIESISSKVYGTPREVFLLIMTSFRHVTQVVLPI